MYCTATYLHEGALVLYCTILTCRAEVGMEIGTGYEANLHGGSSCTALYHTYIELYHAYSTWRGLLLYTVLCHAYSTRRGLLYCSVSCLHGGGWLSLSLEGTLKTLHA